ncbi:MAG: hypothetical protein GX201_00070 [Clostridiales bacterium]|nr:hypothetical protein [Clostridiales bacterium]
MPLGYEYKRYFIILQEEDKGYEMTAGKIPTGYVKIEIKKNKVKIGGFIQNMKSDKKSKYRLNLLAPREKLILDIGLFRMDNNGRGEFYAEFDSDNVNNSNVPISEFTGALVVAGSGFPLVGYTGRESIPWRDWYEKDKKIDLHEDREEEKRDEEAIKEGILEVDETRIDDESIVQKEPKEIRDEETEISQILQEEPREEAIQEEEMREEALQEDNIIEIEEIEIEEDTRQPEEIQKTVVEPVFIDEEIMEMRAEPAPLYFEEPEHIERDSFHETDFRNLIEDSDTPERHYKKEKGSESKLQKRLLNAIKNMEKYDDLYSQHSITWYKVGKKLPLLNNVMIPINGAIMPLSYPYIAETGGRNIEKSLLGVEYRDKEIRYVYIGIPGIYYPACRVCYQYKGFSNFKKVKGQTRRGYWIMCIDIIKGKVCRA